MFLNRYGFSNLLLWLIVLVFVQPLLFSLMPSDRFAQVAYHVSLTLVLAASVYVLCHQRRVLIIGGALFVPTLLSSWAFLIEDVRSLAMANILTNLIFFGYVIVQLLHAVFRAPRVTREVVAASLCGYLLLGLLWASAFALLEVCDPGSFEGALLLGSDPQAGLLYFSFVTLTSLGYGDVLPVSVEAKSLAAFEVVMGQFYMTVLVARLVGMQIAQQPELTHVVSEEESWRQNQK